MKSLFLVRHGQSRNQIGQEGWLDPDLSEEGIRQAERIRSYFAERTYELIISSPLTRARRTFNLSGARADRCEFDSRLVECAMHDTEEYDYRRLLPYPTPDYAEPDRFNMWKVPSGERIESLLADIRQRPEQQILLFGHCAIFYVLLQHVEGNFLKGEPEFSDEGRRLLMDNTALSELVIGESPEQDRVVRWNLNIQDLLVPGDESRSVHSTVT